MSIARLPPAALRKQASGPFNDESLHFSPLMFHQLRHLFATLFAFAAIAMSLVLCCCDQAGEDAQSAPKLQLTPQAKIDGLIAKKLLRVDINFLQYHPPPEEPADLRIQEESIPDPKKKVPE